MRQAVLHRACKITLDFATAKKRHEITRLLEAYRGAVNFYIRTIWRAGGKLDRQTLGRLPKEDTRLTTPPHQQVPGAFDVGGSKRLTRPRPAADIRRMRDGPSVTGSN
jgi:hypothetical protein